MFGQQSRPPEPPKFEPFIILVVACAVATILTLLFYGVWELSQRSDG